MLFWIIEQTSCYVLNQVKGKNEDTNLHELRVQSDHENHAEEEGRPEGSQWHGGHCFRVSNEGQSGSWKGTLLFSYF